MILNFTATVFSSYNWVLGHKLSYFKKKFLWKLTCNISLAKPIKRTSKCEINCTEGKLEGPSLSTLGRQNMVTTVKYNSTLA